MPWTGPVLGSYLIPMFDLTQSSVHNPCPSSLGTFSSSSLDTALNTSSVLLSLPHFCQTLMQPRDLFFPCGFIIRGVELKESFHVFQHQINDRSHLASFSLGTWSQRCGNHDSWVCPQTLGFLILFQDGLRELAHGEPPGNAMNNASCTGGYGNVVLHQFWWLCLVQKKEEMVAKVESDCVEIGDH